MILACFGHCLTNVCCVFVAEINFLAEIFNGSREVRTLIISISDELFGTVNLGYKCHKTTNIAKYLVPFDKLAHKISHLRAKANYYYRR